MIATLFSQAFQSSIKDLIKKIDKVPVYAEWNDKDKEFIVNHLKAIQDYIEKCHIKNWREMKRTNPLRNSRNDKSKKE